MFYEDIMMLKQRLREGISSMILQMKFHFSEYTCASNWMRKSKFKTTISDPKFQTLLFSEPPDFFAYSDRTSL